MKPHFNFKIRSEEKELIDLGPEHYAAEEYQECMEKLFLINRLLGFFSHTKRILKKFSSPISVLDIGCGDGLFLIKLSNTFKEMQFKGIDISADAIQLAQKKSNSPNLSFTCQSFSTLAQNEVDIILATLVCHHLSTLEIRDFFLKAISAARKAVIINDLHRHPIPHWLYGKLSPVLFRNRLITHDGLISIRRGFTRHELKNILHDANIKNYSLKWHFPFRWSLILWKE